MSLFPRLLATVVFVFQSAETYAGATFLLRQLLDDDLEHQLISIYYRKELYYAYPTAKAFTIIGGCNDLFPWASHHCA